MGVAVVAIRLAVYVDDDCLTGSRSHIEAEEVQNAFPNVEVVVASSASDEGDYRHLVAAVPTHILNGRVVSLGNLTFDALSVAIRELATERVRSQRREDLRDRPS